MYKPFVNLLVVFGVAAGMPTDAVAKKQRKQDFANEPTPQLARKTQNQLRQHCSPDVKVSAKTWIWDDALLTARLSKTSDGTSLVTEFIDANNIHTKLPIASITKSMTAYLVLDAIKKGQLSPGQRIPVLPESLCLKDSEFAIKDLPKDIMQTGITVSDALTHILRLSSNPMAYNLAVAVAGSEEKFVERMNGKARSWGMADTHFMNSHGLPVGDRKSEHTTASDLLKMAERIIPDFDLFQTYSHAPLMVDDKPYAERKNKAKDYLRDLGAVYKTATISQCRSLYTIAEDGEDKIVSIQLCAKKDRLARVKEILEAVLGIKSAAAAATPQ